MSRPWRLKNDLEAKTRFLLILFDPQFGDLYYSVVQTRKEKEGEGE
jgi:hypothetical protein